MATDSLELELQMVVSCLTWELQTELESIGRSLYALKALGHCSPNLRSFSVKVGPIERQQSKQGSQR